MHWWSFASGVVVGLFLFWLVLFLQAEDDPNWKSPPDDE
jgi:hypothetical protein